MYNILNVSNFIVRCCNEKGYKIGKEKLSILLAFAQIGFVAVNGKIGFKDDIEIREDKIWIKIIEDNFREGFLYYAYARYLMADDDRIMLRMIVDAIGGYDNKILFSILKRRFEEKISEKEIRRKYWYLIYDDVLISESCLRCFWWKSECGKDVRWRINNAAVERGGKFRRLRREDVMAFFGNEVRNLEWEVDYKI